MQVNVVPSTLRRVLPDKRIIEYTNLGNGKTETKIFDELHNCILEKSCSVEKHSFDGLIILRRKKIILKKIFNDIFGNKFDAEAKIAEFYEKNNHYDNRGILIKNESIYQKACSIPSVAKGYYCNTIGNKSIKTRFPDGNLIENIITPNEAFFYSKKIYSFKL